VLREAWSQGSPARGLGLEAASAARLRNLLVHRYWAISDERVYESIKNGLRDFEEFVARVRAFLGRGGAET